MRSTLKRVFEATLAHGGAAHVIRGLRRRPIVLAYHNVVPDEGGEWGDPSLHLPRARFVEQIERLAHTHEIAPLASLLEDAGGNGRRPRAAITFDDAYRGAVTIGVRELARRGLPATIFVAPALLGNRAFWWDALSDPRGGLDPVLRRTALDELEGEDAAVREWAREAGRPTRIVSEIARSATEAELRSAVRLPGITLASHGWSHRNLTRLDGRELIAELIRPLEWLRARFEAVLPWLSYPYGLRSPAVQDAVSGYGYEAAVRVGGRWPAPRHVDRFAVPRQNIPAGISPDGFELRVSGVLRA